MLYVDTSVIVKLYIKEEHSLDVSKLNIHSKVTGPSINIPSANKTGSLASALADAMGA